MTELLYKSKIDIWLAALAMGGPLAGAGLLAVLSLTYEVRLRDVGVVLAVLLAAAAFTAWVFGSTYYIVGSEHLVVSSGPFRWRIPLSSIVSVRPSHNPLSSPALSLDRLQIRYGHRKTLLISPNNRQGFLRELADRAPGADVASADVAAVERS